MAACVHHGQGYSRIGLGALINAVAGSQPKDLHAWHMTTGHSCIRRPLEMGKSKMAFYELLMDTSY